MDWKNISIKEQITLQCIKRLIGETDEFKPGTHREYLEWNLKRLKLAELYRLGKAKIQEMAEIERLEVEKEITGLNDEVEEQKIAEKRRLDVEKNIARISCKLDKLFGRNIGKAG